MNESQYVSSPLSHTSETFKLNVSDLCSVTQRLTDQGQELFGM